MTSKEISEALGGKTAAEREAWVELLRRGAQNLVNACHALQGNLPEAQPDPETWAVQWLAVGLDQIDAARTELEDLSNHQSKGKEQW